jgi:hypothetical protein
MLSGGLDCRGGDYMQEGFVGVGWQHRQQPSSSGVACKMRHRTDLTTYHLPFRRKMVSDARRSTQMMPPKLMVPCRFPRDLLDVLWDVGQYTSRRAHGSQQIPSLYATFL